VGASDEPCLAVHGGLGAGVDVAVDEVLEDNFGILEVGDGVVVALPVDLGEGLLEVFNPPDRALDVCVREDVPGWSSKYSFCLTSSWERR
jgi:hypothetical protein